MERNDRLWYNKTIVKGYLWTFQKFVRKLTPNREKIEASVGVSLTSKGLGG